MWRAVVAGEICSESIDSLGSSVGGGNVRESVFQPRVLLSEVLNDEDINLLHLIVKGIVNELMWCGGRNVLWWAEDGGRGVCSSDVPNLVQKPVSAAKTQFTHATRGIRAHQVAGRVVCGSKADIAAGISAGDSATMEKSFLQLVSHVLCGATATQVQHLDSRRPCSLYTLASEPQPSVRVSRVFWASFNSLWCQNVQDNTADCVESAERHDT